MTCTICTKRVPPQYEEAHRQFHQQDNGPWTYRQRSAERDKNIRLSRIRRRQSKAKAAITIN